MQPQPIVQKPTAKSWSELFSNGAEAGRTPSGLSTAVSSLSGMGSQMVSQPPSRPASRSASSVAGMAAWDGAVSSPDASFLYGPPMPAVCSRPIVNPGNRCYLNAVLQVLLHTRPFHNYLCRYLPRLELFSSLLATGRYPLLAALQRFFGAFIEDDRMSVLAMAVDASLVDGVFDALCGKTRRFSATGFDEQEDAEEFLTALLDALGEELSDLRQHLPFALPFESSVGLNVARMEDEGEWLEVGPKQRLSTTRTTPVAMTPLHVLFAGSFRSLYRVSATRPSITLEPFTVLPLALCDDHGRAVHSVEEALAHVTRCERLADRATKQLSFAALPPILVLQLKRFIHSGSSGGAHAESLHKDTRSIAIPATMQLDTTHGTRPTTFRLYAVINHHGASLHGGHYTAHVRGDANDWMLFDDERSVKKSHDSGPSPLNTATAYLLFYQREEH